MPAGKDAKDRLTFLKEIPPFSTLSDDQLKIILNDIHPKKYRKDEIIFHQGDSSRDLCIVHQGKVRIYKDSLVGNETSIIIFSVGDVIGEFAMLDNLPRSATAKALTACTLLIIAADTFMQRMHEMPELAIAMSKLLVEKLRWTAEYAKTIAQYDAAGRLLRLLLLYNEQFNEVSADKTRYELDLSLKNQADLASLIGVRRERVSKILTDWRRRGLVEYQAGKIIILDLPRVQAELDSRRNQSDW